jgi:UDP-glucose 4-epimerase
MILITGGAGYIGSHVAKHLLEANRDIVILDNLSTGKVETLDTLKTIKEFVFKNIDLCEVDKVKDLVDEYNIDTIIHFAASIVVPESVIKPLKYYMNNTANTINLINIAVNAGVKKFIFSSTAAVYGEPETELENGIDENYPTKPINPYGQSKLMSEWVLKDAVKASKDMKYLIFRYFNVAGADINYTDGELKPRIGQSFPNATHLIKIAAKCAAGISEGMKIFGDDYPTIDGTCIRDYIHVDDLAMAHIKAIEYLKDNDSDIFNCGYGKGYSVKEVIKTMKKVSSSDFSVTMSERRAGDPSFLISNNNKILSKMGWVPKNDNIELICESALIWEKLL